MELVLLEKARVALRDCLRIEPGQSVLVLDDGTLSSRLTTAFVHAAHALDATPLTMTYTSARFLSLREFGLFAAASFREGVPALAQPLLRAILAADAVVILSSDMSIMFDEGFRAVLAEGAKVAWGPYLTEDAFLRLLPDTGDEARELLETTTRVGEVFSGEHDVAVRSDAGTDLQMRVGEYRVNWGTGVYSAGKGYGGLEIWPGGQISTVPVAGSANGRLVIDRSINVPEFRELLGPVELTVAAGYVTDVQGGAEARRLARFLEGMDDGGEAYHLTELGVGTNRRCKMAGVAGPTEDTHTWGCVSLALGADVHLGGETAAGCHVDMTMHTASLELDGTAVVERGNLLA